MRFPLSLLLLLIPSQELETASLFGIKPWVGLNSGLSVDDFEMLYRSPSQQPPDTDLGLRLPPPLLSAAVLTRGGSRTAAIKNAGNILWAATLGWMLALAYVFGGIVMMLTILGRPYASLCWELAGYYFWPFGKYILVFPSFHAKRA